LLRELLVKKKDGRIENFDRDKLNHSIQLALHKRPIDNERIERVISAIVRQLETTGETEIPSHTIGESVMTALLALIPLLMYALLLFIKISMKLKILRNLLRV